MKRLGAGIIGLGVGEQHIAGFRRPPACDVVSLCDQSEEKLRCVAKKHPQCKQTTHWRQLLDDQDIDVLSIASFDDAHFEQTVAALHAGKHVFVEKPLCCSVTELTEIKTTFKRSAGVQLSSNLVLRAAPVYRWLHTALQGGEFGEVYSIDGEYLFGRIHKITDGWRKDVVDYSVMQGGGVHFVDLMLWLTGQRPVTVTCDGNHLCTNGTAFLYNDFMAATFVFDSGLIGRITANFGCVHPHQHVLRVFGTKATFLLDDQGPRLFASRDPETAPKRIEMPILPSAKWDLIPEFVDSIVTGANRNERAQREFDTISACLAADESVRTGQKTKVKYV